MKNDSNPIIRSEEITIDVILFDNVILCQLLFIKALHLYWFEFCTGITSYQV